MLRKQLIRIIVVPFMAAMLFACLSPDGQRAARDSGRDTLGDSLAIARAADSVVAKRVDSLQRAIDSLRKSNLKDTVAEHGQPDPADSAAIRAVLTDLAGNLQRLPVPMGTRYNSIPRPPAAPKTGAVQACKDTADIVAMHLLAPDDVGMDTLTYYDAEGIPHCTWQAPTSREIHRRYLLDPAAGEAWETIAVSITEDDAFPRYKTRGTGRIRLVNGREIAIDAFEIEMLLDNSTRIPIFQDAHLRLSWEGGYSAPLDLVIERPFRALDLYPAWENLPDRKKVMSGPILRGSAAIGFFDLLADRSVVIRDRAGHPVAPR